MRITYFNLGFDRLLVRYYLMMTIVVASFMLGVPFMAALALPVFVSSLMGIKVERNTASLKKSRSTINSTFHEVKMRA